MTGSRFSSAALLVRSNRTRFLLSSSVCGGIPGTCGAYGQYCAARACACGPGSGVKNSLMEKTSCRAPAYW